MAEQKFRYPLGSNFRSDVTDRSEGIDGVIHRMIVEQLEKATLKKYNVATLEELPIDFAGIVMQADEEYDKYGTNILGHCTFNWVIKRKWFSTVDCSIHLARFKVLVWVLQEQICFII